MWFFGKIKILHRKETLGKLYKAEMVFHVFNAYQLYQSKSLCFMHINYTSISLSHCHIFCFKIVSLLNYQEREETFREISEQTNWSVLWWAMSQTAILLSVGFWQMKRLKDFLIEKKLVWCYAVMKLVWCYDVMKLVWCYETSLMLWN